MKKDKYDYYVLDENQEKPLSQEEIIRIRSKLKNNSTPIAEPGKFTEYLVNKKNDLLNFIIDKLF